MGENPRVHNRLKFGSNPDAKCLRTPQPSTEFKGVPTPRTLRANIGLGKVQVRSLQAHEVTNTGGPDIVRIIEPKGEGSPELLTELLEEDKASWTP